VLDASWERSTTCAVARLSAASRRPIAVAHWPVCTRPTRAYPVPWAEDQASPSLISNQSCPTRQDIRLVGDVGVLVPGSGPSRRALATPASGSCLSASRPVRLRRCRAWFRLLLIRRAISTAR
jgi:hypothetical protein